MALPQTYSFPPLQRNVPMKSHLIAGLAGLSLIALAGPAMAAPAAAPAAAAAKVVPGIAVVNAQEVLVSCNAFKAANQERQAT